MGDDLPDLKVMRHVALAACPADAHPWLVPHAAWCAPQPGGHGAARAFCDMLLEAQGHLDTLLADLLAARPTPIGARA
jgi:3-deoxy-D-manno-octulosonate 8-phosphate phosphatase (KDO 8-P phosphatase)